VVLRTEGAANLLEAAQSTGVRRAVAQCDTGWNNRRDVDRPVTEDDPFDSDPAPQQRQSLAAIRALEAAVLSTALDGLVLRYGNLNGHGASDSMVNLLRQRKLPVIGHGAGNCSNVAQTSLRGWATHPQYGVRIEPASQTCTFGPGSSASTTSRCLAGRRCLHHLALGDCHDVVLMPS